MHSFCTLIFLHFLIAFCIFEDEVTKNILDYEKTHRNIGFVCLGAVLPDSSRK